MFLKLQNFLHITYYEITDTFTIYYESLLELECMWQISLKLNMKIRDMFLQSDVSFFTSETPETNKTKTSIKPNIEWKEIRGKSGYRNM